MPLWDSFPLLWYYMFPIEQTDLFQVEMRHSLLTLNGFIGWLVCSPVKFWTLTFLLTVFDPLIISFLIASIFPSSYVWKAFFISLFSREKMALPDLHLPFIYVGITIIDWGVLFCLFFSKTHRFLTKKNIHARNKTWLRSLLYNLEEDSDIDGGKGVFLKVLGQHNVMLSGRVVQASSGWWQCGDNSCMADRSMTI